MKIVTIVGARPQFIKIAQVSTILRQYHKEILVHTGQHYDDSMSKIFFDELGIPNPDYNLGVGSGSHALQTGNMMIEIENILIKEKPDLLLIYGDTNSTLAAAITAAKLKIPIAHVEAGLRNFDKTIPEEINRLLSDHLSVLLFVPTKTAMANLEKEDLSENAYFTGDVMYDHLLSCLKVAEVKSKVLNTFNLVSKQYVLATIHRPENTDNHESLINIFKGLGVSGEKVIVPLHPRTVKELKSIGYNPDPNILIISPQGPQDFLILLKNARLVLTDSGGIQKEAYLLKVPCLTVYESTSWVETVQDGWNLLVKPDSEEIAFHINNFNPQGKQTNHFGNGDAGKIIVNKINEYFLQKMKLKK